jgi:hypothetical protein
MHEFICCEDASCMSLTSEDMVILPQFLYLGNVFIAFSGDDAQDVGFTCKAVNSLCDIFTNVGCALMSTALPIADTTIDKKRTILHRAMRPVIGVDSAAVRYVKSTFIHYLCCCGDFSLVLMCVIVATVVTAI